MRGDGQAEHQLTRSALIADVNPYRGLRYFREEDSSYFFGRESLSQQIFERVKEHRFVSVVGASGSGKSSVVHAGVLPRVRRDDRGGRAWAIVSVTPESDPARSLAERLAPLIQPTLAGADLDREVAAIRGRLLSVQTQDKGALGRLIRQVTQNRTGIDAVLLLVDQFEELYTLAPESGELGQTRFIDELVAAAGDPDVPLHTLVTLRGDFHHRATSRRDLADLMNVAQVNVGPMHDDELREAIAAPATALHTSFEAGLVDRILADMTGETNALPLLEFLLEGLWTKRADDDGRLTHAAYEALGGVKRAITSRANRVFDAMSPSEQDLARQLMLRLVRPGSGALDSKRPAELNAADAHAEHVLATLTSQRLLVVDEDRVELAHEALIREWQVLRSWVDGVRSDLLLRDRLEAEADRWASTFRRDRQPNDGSASRDRARSL
ncbi:MAG: hypothetical protein AAFX85_18360, partial [Pseudomonadota bacterium]